MFYRYASDRNITRDDLPANSVLMIERTVSKDDECDSCIITCIRELTEEETASANIKPISD